MTFATFVLSTGRCGTQWLAEELDRAYADVLRVEHEPLHAGYRPREMLGARALDRLPPEEAQPVRAHLDAIERELADRPYLECGHPCWSAIPCLAERFAGRCRVVHLTREPVATARSWLTMQAYQPPLAPHLQERVLLSPFDDGAAFPEYRPRWPTLSPFEKCLYYWAEVHAFGLAQETRLGVPWLRISSEDLFDGVALERLLAFLELPRRQPIFDARARRVDRYRFLSTSPADPAALASHPRILAVADRLGYPRA